MSIDMSTRIGAALDALAAREGVRVLLAVESGSRAWGFPSCDSDWDVRFIYARPLAAYLSVTPRPDTLEQPVDDGLDLSGWDVRKALGLLTKSNAPVLEWLCSPMTYRREEDVACAMAALAQRAAHLPQLAHHYDRLARNAWAPGQDAVRLKSVFYALRPALALSWMRRHRTAPPMDLAALMAGLDLSPSLIEAIADLRRRKAAGTEADTVPRCPAVEAFLTECLAEDAPRPAPWDRTEVIAASDTLMLRLAGL
jgi:predicted nucleotidyltransferase